MSKLHSFAQHNICGVIISVYPQDKNQLLNFLMSLEYCEIIDSTDIKLGAVIEDSPRKSAIDTLNLIKENPLVQSITLVNHFFE